MKNKGVMKHQMRQRKILGQLINEEEQRASIDGDKQSMILDMTNWESNAEDEQQLHSTL
jgi:hypothetical protein